MEPQPLDCQGRPCHRLILHATGHHISRTMLCTLFYVWLIMFNIVSVYLTYFVLC